MVTAIAIARPTSRQSPDCELDCPEPINAEEWVRNRARQHWLHRGELRGEPDCDWFAALDDFDELCADMQLENLTWYQKHQDSLIQKHPEWLGHFIAIACHTDSVVLAVADDRSTATCQALDSWELRQAAINEGLPPQALLTKIFVEEP